MLRLSHVEKLKAQLAVEIVIGEAREAPAATGSGASAGDVVANSR